MSNGHHEFKGASFAFLYCTITACDEALFLGLFLQFPKSSISTDFLTMCGACLCNSFAWILDTNIANAEVFLTLVIAHVERSIPLFHLDLIAR